MALVEVVACSDVPTQILGGALLVALGHQPLGPDGRLRLAFVAPLLILDSGLLLGLIWLLLHLHHERAAPLFFGGRPWWPEARLALPNALGALLIAGVVLVGIRAVAPQLRTVAQNPFEALLSSPGNAAVFAVVGVIAGGVREEVQRAFVLRRFERYLGGPLVGLAASSLAFGAGHFLQGADAAIVTGVLGAYWGVLYLRRGSIVAPVLSHGAFNALQVGLFLVSAR